MMKMMKMMNKPSIQHKEYILLTPLLAFKQFFRVGSKYERQFWKVIDASLQSYDPSTESGPTYFFPSPEAYENAKNVKISKKRKQSWKNRRNGSTCDCLSAHVCH